MAAKKTENEVLEAQEANKEDTVRIKLPKNKGYNANQTEFYSVNFKNYTIQRGVYVDVPKELAEVIMNGEKAEDEAEAYAEENKAREA